MILEEISEMYQCKNERELITLLEKIDDKIHFRGYTEEQVLEIVNRLSKADLVAMKYESREELLNVLCDAVSQYNIYSKIDWQNIYSVSSELEEDLREYISEFLQG